MKRAVFVCVILTFITHQSNAEMYPVTLSDKAFFEQLRNAVGLRGLGRYPPLARQWADPSLTIPGWVVVPGGSSSPQPGDVIAERIDFADASGHVGIVVGKSTTASADSTQKPPGIITFSTFGFRPDSDRHEFGHARNAVARRRE